MSDIGNLIRDRRLELGLTLEAVGKHVGVSKSTVRKWESGMIRNMGIDKVARLASILDLPHSSLIPSGWDEDVPFSSEEIDLILLYRGAEEMARKIAYETLFNNQKKSTSSKAK